MPASSPWGNNLGSYEWDFDADTRGPFVEVPRSGIPPPAGARYDAGGSGGLYDAFPGHSGFQGQSSNPAGWGAPASAGRTPFISSSSLPQWAYQPPPPSASNNLPWTYGQYGPPTPVEQLHTPGQSWGTSTPATDPHWPATPASAYARQSPYVPEAGFSSLAWRPPELERSSWPPPHSAPPAGASYFAAERSTSGQPVATGDSYFAQQGRARSRSRQRHQGRFEDEFLGDAFDDPFGNPLDNEAEELRLRGRELARAGRHTVREDEEDLLEGFQGMSLNRSHSRHGRGERSRSRKREKQHKSAMKRSNSLGGGAVQAYGMPERRVASYGLDDLVEQRRLNAFEYNDDDVVRRPRDWRADYSVRNGFFSKVPGMRHRSDVNEITDPHRRTVHPLLHLTSPSAPPLIQDLRFDPLHYLQFPQLPRKPNELDYAQMACHPPTQHMRLYHSRLPWYVDVQATRANGVTVWDVVSQLWQSLQTPISKRDFYNEEMAMPLRSASMSGGPGIGLFPPMSPGRRVGVTGKDEVARAFKERCRLIGQSLGDPPQVGEFGEREWQEIQMGVRRVDWLGMERRVIWIGLVRGKNGMWEIKTDKASR